MRVYSDLNQLYWPNTPSSYVTFADIAYIPELCPCSDIPESSESNARSRPASSVSVPD